MRRFKKVKMEPTRTGCKNGMFISLLRSSSNLVSGQIFHVFNPTIPQKAYLPAVQFQKASMIDILAAKSLTLDKIISNNDSVGALQLEQ
jgi:hypothetical protein